LWFWKIEQETIKKESFKILSLNLVEVTVPFGWCDVEYPKDQEGQIIDSEKPKLIKNSLIVALDKKKKKYVEIEAYANHLIQANKQKLLQIYHVREVRVKIHYVLYPQLV
jgi:hypothetical protein